jgi:hypothetical protein
MRQQGKAGAAAKTSRLLINAGGGTMWRNIQQATPGEVLKELGRRGGRMGFQLVGEL